MPLKVHSVCQTAPFPGGRVRLGTEQCINNCLTNCKISTKMSVENPEKLTAQSLVKGGYHMVW